MTAPGVLRLAGPHGERAREHAAARYSPDTGSAVQAQAGPQSLDVTGNTSACPPALLTALDEALTDCRAQNGTDTGPLLQAACTTWVTADMPVDAAALKDRAQEGLPDKAALKSGLDAAKHGSKRDLAVRARVDFTAYSLLHGMHWATGAVGMGCGDCMHRAAKGVVSKGG